MRILYFYQYFGTPKGSWSTRVYEFTRRWVQNGDSVTVVTSVYDKSDLKPDKFVSRFDIEGIDVRVLNVKQSNKHGKLLRVFTFAIYAVCSCWYALFSKADVVIASSGPITVGLPGLVARYLRRIPLVFEVRDLWPEGAVQLGFLRNPLLIGMARFFEKTCYRASTRVVALSQGQADWIRDTYRIEHIDVIPNASDNELVERLDGNFKLPSWAEGKQLVLYTGTLGLMDDCFQILEMARILEDAQVDNVEIAFIGDGKERTMLEKRAMELQLQHVHFVGLVSKETALRWLKLASCALLVFKDVPVLATCSPNKLFDAFAAGVPVVQATQGWIHDLFEREQCGVNVAANDFVAMADAVRRLTSDHDFREMVSHNARRVAEELFDRDLLASKMHGVLARSAGKQP